MATNVCIVYYSPTYGHVEKLAKEIQKGGAQSVDGVEAKLRQVPETLPEGVLAELGSPLKSDLPVITPDEVWDDGRPVRVVH